MKKPIFYGTILGGASILWSLAEIVLANVFLLFALSTYTSVIAFFIPLIVLGLAIKREKSSHSFYTEQMALKFGAMVSVIGASIYAVFIYALYSLFPNIINPYIEYVSEKMLADKVAPEEIQTQIETITTTFSGSSQASYSFIFLLTTGVAISYVLGKILKTRHRKNTISTTPQ